MEGHPKGLLSEDLSLDAKSRAGRCRDSWDEPGGHRVEKLDLRKIYPPGKSGRLTFTVHDDRVEAIFREKSAGP